MCSFFSVTRELHTVICCYWPPKVSTWSKLKLQYDKINDSLTSEYGKPTKVVLINTSKKGNELLEF